MLRCAFVSQLHGRVRRGQFARRGLSAPHGAAAVGVARRVGCGALIRLYGSTRHGQRHCKVALRGGGVGERVADGGDDVFHRRAGRRVQRAQRLLEDCKGLRGAVQCAASLGGAEREAREHDDVRGFASLEGFERIGAGLQRLVARLVRRRGAVVGQDGSLAQLQLSLQLGGGRRGSREGSCGVCVLPELVLREGEVRERVDQARVR
mmetsp:Transcript_4394/g.13844  ORF Transcript_4394/g.13844 Transcript_4394/m.13844 type:complete len:207 (+) Transcript_4394:669-1289(+)